jgi:chaperonin GroES
MTWYIQAAQATFKSIKSLVPLLDRVLVQRFKHETVRSTLFPAVRI